MIDHRRRVTKSLNSAVVFARDNGPLSTKGLQSLGLVGLVKSDRPGEQKTASVLTRIITVCHQLILLTIARIGIEITADKRINMRRCHCRFCVNTWTKIFDWTVAKMTPSQLVYPMRTWRQIDVSPTSIQHSWRIDIVDSLLTMHCNCWPNCWVHAVIVAKTLQQIMMTSYYSNIGEVS